MTTYGSNYSGNLPGSAVSAMFDVLQKATLDYGQQAIARVLARADDWLFDLGQKDGPLVGAVHMEALQALRQAKIAIEKGLRRHVERSFQDLYPRGSFGGDGLSDLSLVAEDQLEVQLASEQVIETVLRIHGPALQAIERRLATLVGVGQLEPKRNPLSAAAFANAIREAQREVTLPDPVRVALFKYYERELSQTLDGLLNEINQRLIAAGILPELGVPRPTESHHAPAPAPAPAAPAEDRQAFDALCDLLHQWRPQAPSSLRGRRPLAGREMLSVLSVMQPKVPQSVVEAMGRPEASLAQMLKQELLRGASNLGLSPSEVRLTQEDEDAVDLVGMLFDVLFDERDFEQIARAVLARMVVPYAKVAVIDRSLFMRKTHPARRLLNSVAEACESNRGDGPQERELLQKAEGVVDRLVAEFNEDIAIFDTLEQELRSFLDQHRRRVELAERRAAEAQRGQERLEYSRELARRELEQRVAGKPLPAALSDFLQGPWTHHLSITALREGPDSQSWQAAIAVAEQLLGLLDGQPRPSSSVVSVVRNLRQPIESILATSGIAGEPAVQTVDALRFQLEALGEGRAVPKAEPGSEASAPRLAVVGGTDTLDADAVIVATLRKLTVGEQLNMVGTDGKPAPIKLSWISPITSRLMFVNRRGVRVLVASIEELATMVQSGQISLRDSSGVFDQALKRVQGRLQDDAASA